METGKNMDFLQIHDGRPYTLWEYKSILRLKSLLTAQDTYTFLSIPTFSNIIDTTVESDVVRFRWLSEHPNGVYMDTDCYLNKPYTSPANGLPCFPLAPMNPRTFVDIFLIYCNGATEAFAKEHFTLEGRKKYIRERVEPKIQHLYYGWPGELTRKCMERNIISDEYFQHGYATMSSELQRRGYVGK
jgi:hypothetical protein